MAPFVGDVQDRKTHRDKEETDGCSGLGGSEVDGNDGFLCKGMKCAGTDCGDSCVTVNTLKIIQLCPLHE